MSAALRASQWYDVQIRDRVVVDAAGYVAWVMPGYPGLLRAGDHVGTQHADVLTVQVLPCPIMGGKSRTYYAVKGV
jgi:hypothetical protein